MTSIEEQRRLLLERMKATGGGRPPLERRKRRRTSLPPTRKQPAWLARFKRFLPAIPFVLILLAVLMYSPPLNNDVPPYLIGTWRSSTPGYEDRFLLFTQHSVVFGTGGYSGDVYGVYEVKTEPVENDAPAGSSKQELFSIRYRGMDKLQYNLFFYYDPPPVGTITFKNQKRLIWTKESAESTGSKERAESTGSKGSKASKASKGE